MRLFWIFIISSFCWLSLSSQAQIALLGGTNFCWMRNDNLLQHQEVLLSPHFGVSIQYYPFKNAPEISLENGVLLNIKGYRLDLDKDYSFKLRYYSFPVLFVYDINNYLSVSTGFELSYLLFTNQEQGTKTFERFDMGLVAGVEGLNAHTVNPYFRVTYGLVPTVEGYTFDKLGNFQQEYHDLKNFVISLGIKINLTHDKNLFRQ